MSTIIYYTSDHESVEATVQTAIAASIETDSSTVIVGGDDAYDAICDELLLCCDDEAHDGSGADRRADFWGKDDDGQDWRVQVHVTRV